MKISNEILEIFTELGIDTEQIQQDNTEIYAIYRAIEFPEKPAYITTEKYNYGCESDLVGKTIFEKYGIAVKPGRLLHKIFPELDNTTVKKFAAIWSIKYGKNQKSKFLTVNDKEDFLKYYSEDSYENSNGTLGSSCMRGNDEQDFVSFYPDYCDCSLLVCLNELDKVVGRAILWNNILIQGIKYPCFMDRVYINDDNLFVKFFKFAEQNGYARKAKQSYSEPFSFILPDGSEISDSSVYTEISENADSSEYFPFLDTFSGLNYNRLYNQEEEGEYTLQQTDGDKLHNCFCSNCSERVHENDICLIDDEIYCSDCCFWSSLHDCYIREGDCTYIDFYNSYLYDNEIVYCEHLSDDRLSEECEYNENRNEYFFLPDCIETKDTGIFLPESYVNHTDDDGNYYENEKEEANNVA